MRASRHYALVHLIRIRKETIIATCTICRRRVEKTRYILGSNLTASGPHRYKSSFKCAVCCKIRAMYALTHFGATKTLTPASDLSPYTQEMPAESLKLEYGHLLS
jgi:hypothetical protein